MKEKDYLKMIDDLEQAIPKPSDTDIARTRWIAEWQDMLMFFNQSLGKIDRLTMDEFTKSFNVPINVYGEEKRQWEWKLMKNNFKNGLVLLRDWIKRRHRYVPSTQASSIKPEKVWLYWTNGKVVYLQITGKAFALNDVKQSRGKNAAAHLMDLLSFPGHVALITVEEFKKRITDAGEQYSTSKTSNTFKDAIRRINNLVGKTPSGKQFLHSTIQGCKINEAFVAEFDPNLGQV